MRAVAAFAIALLGPLLGTEGSPLLDALDERIVNGQEAAKNSIPWQVALVNTGGRQPWCGGTILCSKYVMTAAHCTSHHNKKGFMIGVKSPSEIEVIAGEHNWWTSKESESSSHKVRRIINHPYYKNAAQGYDFSILELENPIDLSSKSNARPACLPSPSDTRFFKLGTKFVVSGWGRLAGHLNGPASLHHVTLPWVHVSATRKFGVAERYRKTMMCAGNMERGGVSACRGDSGGPLTWKASARSRTKLVGVVSFGSQDCGGDTPTVFGKVTAVLDWINTNTGSCSGALSSCCGSLQRACPKPKPAGTCDLRNTLTEHNLQHEYAGQTKWLQYGYWVRVNCDWNLQCEVVEGGRQGETPCQKICGYNSC